MDNPFMDPGYMILLNKFGSQAGMLIDRVKRGQLDINKIMSGFDRPPGKNNLEDILSSIVHSFRALKVAASGILAILGEIPLQILARGLHHVADVAKGLHEVFQNLSPNAKRFASALFAVGTTIMTIVPILKVGMSIARMFSSALGLTALSAILPGGPVIVGILGIGAASLAIYKYWDQIKAYFKDSGPLICGIGAAIENTGRFLKEMAVGLGQMLEGVAKTYEEAGWDGLVIQFKIKMVDALIFIKENWYTLWIEGTDWFSEKLGAAVNVTANLMRDAYRWVSENSWSEMADAFKSKMIAAWNWFINFTGFGKSVEELKLDKAKLTEQYTGAKRAKSIDTFKQLYPDIKNILPEGTSIPLNMQDPKEFLQTMQSLKEANMCHSATQRGYPDPESRNTASARTLDSRGVPFGSGNDRNRMNKFEKNVKLMK
jgi:hypothetical protein